MKKQNENKVKNKRINNKILFGFLSEIYTDIDCKIKYSDAKKQYRKMFKIKEDTFEYQKYFPVNVTMPICLKDNIDIYIEFESERHIRISIYIGIFNRATFFIVNLYNKTVSTKFPPFKTVKISELDYKFLKFHYLKLYGGL